MRLSHSGEVVVTNNSGQDADNQSYALTVAGDSYDWYRSHAIRSRRAYRVSESLVLIISASIPVSAVIAPHNNVAPSVFGVIVVVLAGLRVIFHWQDNYLRFSGAREAVENERRLYLTHNEPYQDEATRDRILVVAISRIEQEEMGGWIKVASERLKP